MSTPDPSRKHVARGAGRRRLVVGAFGTVNRRWRRAPFMVGATLALLVGLGAGVADAWLSSTGSGSATASVSGAQSVTVLAATGTPNSELFPGANADLTLTVKNPTDHPVTIVSVSQNPTLTVAVVGGTGCTAGNSGVTVPTQSGLEIPVTVGTSVVVHIPDGVAMASSSANGCQGASFHIPVDIAVRRK